MPELNINQTAVTNLKDAVVEYSVPSMATDAATGQKESEWINTKARQYLGYYKKIPELKKAIDAFATWVIGKGYTADPVDTVILEHIKGWGEDTFNSLLWNMIVTKKIYGDAFAEIIKADNREKSLLNLKPLDPGSIKIICNEKGMIKRYEQFEKTDKTKLIHKFEPEEILHLCNDRIADEIHGISVIDACEQVILMRNEAMTDWKTVLKRNVNPLKVWYVDTEDTSKIDLLRDRIEKTVKDKENIIIPMGTVPKVDIIQAPLVAPLDWIKYLENFFYQAVGIPKIILGGSEEFTEASSKIAYLTFEQVYRREQQELESDLWSQLGIKIIINKPASLKSEMLSSEEKNTGQVGFQPTEMMPGRNE